MAHKGELMGRVLDAAPMQSALAAVARKAVLDRLGAVFFAVAVLAVAAYGWARPDYNWDMVAYVATALEDRHPEAESLHRATWAEIERNASPAQLFHLQKSNPYNLHQWQNPADFQSQLGMYRVKAVYVALLRALEPWTGLANAAFLLSVLPTVGFGGVLLWWLARADALQAGFVLLPALLLADLSHMANAATPDMLLALVSVLALYCVARGRDVLAAVLLVASVFVRPDSIILVFALLIAAFLFNWRKLPYIAAFALSLVACVFISRHGGHPGWWAHFVFSCVEIQNSMAGFQPDFSFAAFAKGYVRGVMVALADNDWPGLFLLLLGGWALAAKAGLMRGGRANGLMFALSLGTLGKFASFPLPDDRFYFVFVAGLMVTLLAKCAPSFAMAGSTRSRQNRSLLDLAARPAPAE